MNSKLVDTKDHRFIENGQKKYKIRYIKNMIPISNKIHRIYYKEAISNNDNLQERIKFTEAYNKEVNNLITMNVMDLKVKLPLNKIPQNKIISTNTMFTIKRNGTHKARIVCRGDKQDEPSNNGF